MFNARPSHKFLSLLYFIVKLQTFSHGGGSILYHTCTDGYTRQQVSAIPRPTVVFILQTIVVEKYLDFSLQSLGQVTIQAKEDLEDITITFEDITFDMTFVKCSMCLVL